MKPPRKYASAAAFRIALEDRLKRMAREEDVGSRSKSSGASTAAPLPISLILKGMAATKPVMSVEFYVSTATESASRAALLPKSPSEDISHLLGTIQPLAEPEEPDYGPCQQTDWIIKVGWKECAPLDPKMLGAAFSKAAWRRDDGPTLYGKDAATGKWTYLLCADGPNNVTALKLAWPYYASRRDLPGFADCDLFEERLAGVQNATFGFVEPVIQVEIDPAVAAKRATHFANLHGRFGGSVLLRLKAPFFRTYKGREIWDIMLCLGLQWGDMDCFHWRNDFACGHDSHFSVSTSSEPGYFLPEDVAAGRVNVKDLLFHFSIPRSANPEQVARAMFAAAKYARSRLGGKIESEDGKTAEKEEFLEYVRKQVEELRAESIVPGSATALRLF